jgi:attachment p12 family protein
MIEYIIGIIIAIIAIFIIYSTIKKQLEGKGSCGCSCKNCPSKCGIKKED